MAAPKGNQYAAKGKEVTRALWRALQANKWQRLHQGCEAIADAFANGEPWAAHFVADRLEGKVIAMPDGLEDRSFSVTWSFGPAALEHQSNQALTLPPALAGGEGHPVERDEG